jgi:RNA polymerase sigma factor (sigma-70 family)
MDTRVGNFPSYLEGDMMATLTGTLAPALTEMQAPGSGLARGADAAPRNVERSDEAVAVGTLVQAAAAGDKRAWDRLVDRFAPTVWAVARGHRLNAADAADVSQTTWLRLVENLHRIEQPERVGAWLATTARRESLRVLRLAGRQVPNGDDFELVIDHREDPSRDEPLIQDHRAGIVAGLVEQLPVRSQTLLRLLSADTPLSYKEISEALDMPIGSIGPTRARALEHLKRLAVQAGIDPQDLFS